MPAWAGKWKGGRYYFDEDDKPVFFIECSRNGVRYSIKLLTHDHDLALGELAHFNNDPVEYAKPAPPPSKTDPVFITQERWALYLESIRDAVEDHRKARRSYLKQWADLMTCPPILGHPLCESLGEGPLVL